jgi:hypothetical protein
MITQIGIVAGEIWHVLDNQTDIKLSELVEKINKPKNLVLMSLGWLAREGHILLNGESDYIISLRTA